MSAQAKRVVFVDRDGTIIREPADFQIDSLDKLEYVPGIIAGLKLLVDSGFELVMVSNQDGLGSKKYPRKIFDSIQGKILRLLEGEGITFADILICPHFDKDDCACRKPKLGLLKRYLKPGAFDPASSFALGDRETDVELARALKIRSVRLTGTSPASKLDGRGKPKSRADHLTPDAGDACQWMLRQIRSATIARETKETEIVASLTLDGSGKHDVSTGIPFFDHMIEQLAKHSLVDLRLKAKGDLKIDAHHTVEDVGIVLGIAFRKALGDKRGVERYGFVAPMDEARCEVALDLSGRGFLRFEADFKRPEIGGLPTELVEHFFQSFSDELLATMHIRCDGKNDHHKIEGIFKSAARALRQAIAVNARARRLIPSTKGSAVMTKGAL